MWKPVVKDRDRNVVVARNTIVMKSASVRNFDGDSNHDYEVFLSLEELAKIIDVVSETSIPVAPLEVEQSMTNSMKSLIRIVIAASGLREVDEDLEPPIRARRGS